MVVNSEGPKHGIPIRRTFTIIAAIVVAEPLAATILFPFVYFMIRDFGTVQERYVGFWAGVITSAFFVPQMLMATLLGSLSDKVGRKPVLLLGLLGSAVSVLLFGLSKSLAWAVCSRALCGLFNANAGVSRTAIGELAHNTGLNQGRAFSLFGLCNSVGYVVGPLIGGFLARPAEKFPAVGSIKAFLNYPYLLPCLVSSLYSSLVFVISWAALDETNQDIRHPLPKPVPRPADEQAREQDPLLTTPKVTTPEVQPKSSIWYCILGIACLSLHAIIFDEIYPIFAASPSQNGLQFSSKDIAASLSVMGPIILVVQLLLYPYLNDHFSSLSLWRASAAAFAILNQIVEPEKRGAMMG
ncbi:MAG: hypothetical protein Q9188_002045 [Gyalolechia gomerana]